MQEPSGSRVWSGLLSFNPVGMSSIPTRGWCVSTLPMESQVSKEAWKAFLAWLDEANEAELVAKHQRCIELRKQLTDAELLSSLSRMVRLIEEEQVTRLGIAQRSQRLSRRQRR